MPVRFLSDEWISAMDEAAAASTALAEIAADVSLVVEQQVTGLTGGPISYHLVLIDGRAAVRAGSAPEPTVRLSQDITTATDIAAGTDSAQRAFMTGRLRIGGDLGALLAHAEILGQLDDVFADVRDRTGPPVGGAATIDA